MGKFIIIIVVIMIATICYAQEEFEEIYSFYEHSAIISELVWFDSKLYIYQTTDEHRLRCFYNGEIFNLDLDFYTGGIIATSEYIYFPGANDGLIHYTNNFQDWFTMEKPEDAKRLFFSSSDIFIYNVSSLYKYSEQTESWSEVLFLGWGVNTNIVEMPNGSLFIGITDFQGGAGLYRSDDNGDTWYCVGLEGYYFSEILATDLGELLVSFRGHHTLGIGGILVSYDYGDTFQSLTEDYVYLVSSITVDSEGRIYIGCSNEWGYSGGVYVAEQIGAEWQPVQSNIIDEETYVRKIRFFDGNLFIAAGSNHYSQLFKSIETVDNSSLEVLPLEDYSLNNYPNPFNPSTKISFIIPNNSNIEVNVYNIKGQKIKTLFQDEIDKGSHSILWNGDDDSGKPVSSGVYFYKLVIDGKKERIQKCILLK